MHGHGCIVESGQQILPDVPHLGSILFKAHEDELQMVAVQFHELGFYNLGGLIVARDADEAAFASHSVHQ